MYSSVELYEELHFRNTFACGTVNPLHKNLPKAVVKKDIKKTPKRMIAFLDETMLYCVLDGREKKEACHYAYDHT